MCACVRARQCQIYKLLFAHNIKFISISWTTATPTMHRSDAKRGKRARGNSSVCEVFGGEIWKATTQKLDRKLLFEMSFDKTQMPANAT